MEGEYYVLICIATIRFRCVAHFNCINSIEHLRCSLILVNLN